LREPFPRRSQEEYIEALRKELEMTGNKVSPERYSDLDSDKLIVRPDVDLPDIYAKGGSVSKDAMFVAVMNKKLKGKKNA